MCACVTRNFGALKISGLEERDECAFSSRKVRTATLARNPGFSTAGQAQLRHRKFDSVV